MIERSNLPATGRGTSRRLVEGHARQAGFHRTCAFPQLPSTTPLRVAVPLPILGRC